MVFIINAQTIKRNLLQANILLYRQNVYVFGYEESKNELLFKCYSYTPNLASKDSIEFKLGKHTPADYLEISTDTLHDAINFYFQLANQKNVVTLLRVNDKLQEICHADNIDANHINSLTAFEDEKYVCKFFLYIIKTANDTSGKQFYLSKYQLQNNNKPTEYDYKWQFAFERKYIHRASVLYADSSLVLVYAHVNDGIKKGQWILRINANTGELIKGTKLNPKGDSRYFLVSNSSYEPQTKTFNVIGSIYSADMLDFKKETYKFVNLSKQHKLFLITIDSSGEVITRAEKLFALPLQTNTGKNLISYHVKIRDFKKINTNDFDVWADLYELTTPTVLSYYSSWHIDIKPDDVDYAFTPSPFYVCTKAIPKFISFDKGDSYGKFFLDKISDYDKFKYQKPLTPVVLKTAYNDNNNPYYILKKVNIANSTKNFNYVFIGKKGLENKVFLKSEQGQKADVFFTKGTNYISFTTNTANSEFELKINSL